MKRSIALIAMLCASTAWAEVGTIEQANNGFVIRQDDRSDAVVGAPIEEGDVLETGEEGIIHIRMTDDTKLVVGPETTMSIDAALIGQDTGTFETLAIGMTVGIMRMITGNSENEAYTVDTPVSTMGVRGTGLEHWMDEEAGIVVTEGLVRFCSVAVDPTTGERVIREETCIFVVAQNCIIAATENLSTLNPDDQELTNAQLIRRQEELVLEDYQLDVSQCADRLPRNGGTPPGQAPAPLPPQPLPEPGVPNNGQGQDDARGNQTQQQRSAVADPTLPDSRGVTTFGGSSQGLPSANICTTGVVVASLRFRILELEEEIASATDGAVIDGLEALVFFLLGEIDRIQEAGASSDDCDDYLNICPPPFSDAGVCIPPGLE